MLLHLEAAALAAPKLAGLAGSRVTPLPLLGCSVCWQASLVHDHDDGGR
jgi:hypothetical protein